MDSLLPLLPYIQIVLAILLMGAILVQQRGAGLGGAFGGNEGTIHYERRGFERTLFRGTIVLAIVFVIATALPIFADKTSSSVVIPTDTTAEEAANISPENILLEDASGNPIDVQVNGENVGEENITDITTAGSAQTPVE
jgi:protein translocase SecG subunit